MAAESTYSLTSALILADTPTIQGNTTYIADYDSKASTAQYALTVQNGYFTDAVYLLRHTLFPASYPLFP